VLHYDLAEWVREHGDKPEEGVRARVRNSNWFHMYNGDIISMPDKWEYLWYAVWDLAFHCIPLSLVDVDFAPVAIINGGPTDLPGSTRNRSWKRE
jgi:hypothetical protein